MMRIAAALVLLPLLAVHAKAQIIIRTNPVHSRPQPIGVIPPPTLPVTRTVALGPPAPGIRHHRFGSRFYVNPYYSLWGYPPVWPDWDGYQTTPTIVNNYIPIPVPTPPEQPVPPPELRAQLTLHVPPGSSVWLAGKEVDAAVSPLVLQSPVLNEGQSYTFDVKVKWREGRKTEERSRVVTVEAGDTKSLTYLAAR